MSNRLVNREFSGELRYSILPLADTLTVISITSALSSYYIQIIPK